MSASWSLHTPPSLLRRGSPAYLREDGAAGLIRRIHLHAVQGFLPKVEGRYERVPIPHDRWRCGAHLANLLFQRELAQQPIRAVRKVAVASGKKRRWRQCFGGADLGTKCCWHNQ
jgi:hypothetical protein